MPHRPDLPNLLGTIGNTPLVELKRFDLPVGVRLFAKLEGQNPTGSVKDRVVLRMLQEARARGRIQPGATIVEASTGNTGIALAMIGRLLGYTVKIVVPENVFPEIGRLLGVYGAEIVWVPGELGIKEAMAQARGLADTNGWYFLDQFANEANCSAHYHGTGVELVADLPSIDLFVAGLGTGGTITGTGRRLKEAHPDAKVVAVEPHPGNQVQGLKSLADGYIPPILDLGILDGKVLVRSRQAILHTRQVVEREGIFAGVSAGAVLYAALEFARRMRQGNVVCLFADAGWKYVGTEIWNSPPPDGQTEDDLDDVTWW
jgi:cysteine synthase